MGMRKFGSAAPPFSKVAYVVKGFVVSVFLPLPRLQARTTLLKKKFLFGKGGKNALESTSSSLGSRNWGLKVGKSIVFDGKMGMRKF